MNSLINLMSLIGVEKTLIIACGDYGLNPYLELNDRVFIYFLPDKMLRRHDFMEKERIQHFIEHKGCTQIVFVGTMDESTLSRLNNGDSLQSLRSALRFNLKHWAKDREMGVKPGALRDQLLLELHVIAQCRYLMEYYFIREKVEKKILCIRGVVVELQEEYIKSIFHNGISYNDIISSN